jgi:small-conductance mechanosensitive channel
MTSTKDAPAKTQSFRSGVSKSILYIVVLVVSLSLVNFLFGWESVEEIPPYLQPSSGIILFVHPYLAYIQAGLIFILGYFVTVAISGAVYGYIRKVADHPTAATVRTIARISGVAVLLSLMTSVFNVNPAAALTIGSFGGLVAGFATQTILSHVVAGVFLLVSRPFTYGDTVTVSGQSGVVKEIKLMHIVLESEDGAKEILIPSGTVVTQIIHKKMPPVESKPVKTVLTLDPPSANVTEDAAIILTGKLVEVATRNALAGKIVKIYDSDVGKDDFLASGTTDSDGAFAIKWKAARVDPIDNTAEIYAKFEGDNENRGSKSDQFVVTVQSGKKTRRQPYV